MDLDRSSRGQKGGTASARGAPSANARSDYADENMKPQQSVAKTSSRQPDKKTTPDGKKSDSLSQKTPQATAEQLRMAQMFQNSPTTDQALQEKALQVQELTGCSPDDAIIALHDCGNETEAAVNFLLEGGGDQSEWETKGKKGKKKPKTKQDQEGDDARQNIPYGLNVGTRASRGRQPLRSTSSRGGKANVQSGQRSTGVQEIQEPQSNNIPNGVGPRQQGSRDRAPSPQNSRQNLNPEVRARSAPGGGKGRSDAEPRLWGEDTDDDWNEELRETKVFTRSSVPAPSPLAYGNTAQPAQPQPSLPGGAGPTFSAMVQKQTAWNNSGAAPNITAKSNADPPGNGWRTSASAAGPPLTPQKSSFNGSGLPSDSSLLTSTDSASSGVNPSSLTPDLNADVSEMGSQLGNLTFNRSVGAEPVNQFAIPLQSQIFSSRNSFANAGGHGPIPSTLEFTSSRMDSLAQLNRPAASSAVPSSLTDPLKSQAIHNSVAAFGVQSQTFNNSQQDVPTNTYSARNILNPSTVPAQPSSNQQSSKATISFGDNSNVFSQTSATAVPVTAQNVGPSPSSDARFGQNPSGIGLPKQQSSSPQLGNKFGSPISFSQSAPQRIQPSNQIPLSAGQTSLQFQNQSPQQQSYMHNVQLPSSSPGKIAVSGNASNYSYGSPVNDSSARNSFSGFGTSMSALGKDSLTGQSSQVPQQQSMQQISSAQMPNNISPQRSAVMSNTVPVFSASKPIPSASMSAKPPYGGQPNVSNMLSQQYLQQPYSPQTALQMFPQMYATGLEGMNDPRLHSVMPQGIPMDYSYTTLSGRDPTSMGYTTGNDYAKFRNDSVGQQVQVTQQQPLMNQYQGYQVYSPPIAPNYAQYPPQIYGNLPGYSKAGGSVGGSYPGNSYGDLTGLVDVSKSSYVANLRGSMNDSYGGNPSMLSGGSELQGNYYGNKQNSKFDKPQQQNFGMPLGGQQPGAYPAQYFPMMAQQAMHPMPQMQQGSPLSGQNLNNNKQNKGPQSNYQWPH